MANNSSRNPINVSVTDWKTWLLGYTKLDYRRGSEGVSFPGAEPDITLIVTEAMFFKASHL